MTQVPNPFKVIDDFLLDFVFNPLTWWTEDRYSKNAVDLRLTSTYIAIILLMLIAVLAKSYVLFFICIVFMTVIRLASGLLRNQWQHNNQTGKNVFRVSGFAIRRVIDMLGFSITLAIIHSPHDLAMLLFSVWFLGSFVPGYLDATDATPPRYRDFKLAPQT